MRIEEYCYYRPSFGGLYIDNSLSDYCSTNMELTLDCFTKHYSPLDKYKLITNDNAAIVQDRTTGEKTICKRAKDDEVNPTVGALYALVKASLGVSTKEINEWLESASHHGKKD